MIEPKYSWVYRTCNVKMEFESDCNNIFTDHNHLVASKDDSGDDYSNESGECIIKGGNHTEIPCIFPFLWNGKKYNSCIFKKGGSWCSTKVDKDGKHMQMFWGKCPRNCKVDKTTNQAKGRMMEGERIIYLAINHLRLTMTIIKY